MAMHPTFIVIDDHPLYRQGIMTLISQELHLECVGEAGTISEAIEILSKTKPKLALVDISLQNQNGLELVRLIKSEYPDTLILVVSMHEEALYGERALNAGARGFVMKHENPSVLLDAVQKVLAGRIAVSEDLRQRLLESIVVGKQDSDAASRLSDRELEVFVLIGKGYGATEIAEDLHISVKTVNAHRDHIKEKLCLASAAELRKFAVEWVSRT